MPASIHTSKIAGTFIEQVAHLKLVVPTAAKPTFFYAVGSATESIGEKKELFAAKGGAIVHSGADEVRSALKLGNGPLTLSASVVPSGFTLFVQSSSANRKLKARQQFVVQVSGAERVSTAAETAAKAKRGRSAAEAAGKGDTASRKETLLTKRTGKYWACRFGTAGSAAPSAATRTLPLHNIHDNPELVLVDGATGNPFHAPDCYVDTDVFDAPDIGKPFRPMADEVRKWHWAPTYIRSASNDYPDAHDSDNEGAGTPAPPQWELLQVTEPSKSTAAKTTRCKGARGAQTDGSFIEVWGRDPWRPGDGSIRWADVVFLAQFGPHPLYCACVGGHPFVQTADFDFSNSDGSTEPPHKGIYGFFYHPLQLIAQAEGYCWTQVH